MPSTTCATRVDWRRRRSLRVRRRIRWLAKFSATSLAIVALVACTSETPTTDEASAPDFLSLQFAHVDDKARAFLERKQETARTSSEDASAFGEYAMALEMNGYPSAALAAYRTTAELAPTNPRWSYYEALLLASAGDYPSALDAMDNSLELDSEYGPGWVWKGRWHLELNQLEQARRAFEMAIDKNLQVPGQVGLAQAHLRAGANQDALTLLQKASLLSDHPQITRLIATAESRLGLKRNDATRLDATARGQIGFPDIRSSEKRAFEVSISAELSKFRSLFSQPDRRAQANTVIDSLYDRHPDNVRVAIAKAESLRYRGDDTKLRTFLGDARKQWPNETTFIVGIAELDIATGDAAAALPMLDEVIAREPTNAWALVQQGIAFGQLSDFDSALASFELAMTLIDSPEPHYYAAHAYAERQEWIRAYCHMRRALQLQPQFLDAESQLQRLQNLSRIGSDGAAQQARCASLTTP